MAVLEGQLSLPSPRWWEDYGFPSLADYAAYRLHRRDPGILATVFTSPGRRPSRRMMVQMPGGDALEVAWRVMRHMESDVFQCEEMLDVLARILQEASADPARARAAIGAVT